MAQGRGVLDAVGVLRAKKSTPFDNRRVAGSPLPTHFCFKVNAQQKTSLVCALLCVVFLGLTAAFTFEVFGRVEAARIIPLADPQFTNTATVRLSAAQQFQTGADTSGLECYGCHERNKAPVIKLDARGNILLSREHSDIVMRHGRSGRNESCFNCHDSGKLDQLKTRDGQTFTWEEATQLCASCHGTTYRDWEAGLHGRTTGYWDRSHGSATRQECTSCHHPHAPQFPSMNPAPGPNLLHPKSAKHRSPH